VHDFESFFEPKLDSTTANPQVDWSRKSSKAWDFEIILVYDRTMLKKLVLHIGLPKTATSTMQNRLFPRVQGYLGKPEGYEGRWKKDFANLEEQSSYNMFYLFRSAYEAFLMGQEWQQKLAEWASLLDFTSTPVWVISEEKLFNGDNDVFRGRAASGKPRRAPNPITGFLAELAYRLPPGVTLQTIVTIRNQPDFLGSLAAQRGAKDFTRELTCVIESQDPVLNFHALVIELEQAVGKSNHLTLIFEDGLRQNWARIVGFFELSILDPSRPLDFANRDNARRTGEGSNSWKYELQWTYHRSKTYKRFSNFLSRQRQSGFLSSRKLDGLVSFLYSSDKLLLSANKAVSPEIHRQVSLSNTQREAIRESCKHSNVRLSAHLGRDLASLGY